MSADLERYLHVLAGESPDGRFLEIRFRRTVGMGQQFIPAGETGLAARMIRKLGARSDTYVGVVLRDHRSGRRDAVTRSHLVFVELDADASGELLKRAPRPPSATVRSGTRGHLHCYWLLSGEVTGHQVQQANRELAHHLGGDLASVDETRILRPPQTLSFKHSPPRTVELQSLDTTRVYDLAELTRGLKDPAVREPEKTTRAKIRRPRAAAARSDGELHERLRAIDTVEYVRRLTGQTPNREGKVRCPFHDQDRTPSLHCYPDGTFCCFGCRRGGSIFDFASGLWGLDAKGPDFLVLRQRLAETFGLSVPPRQRPVAGDRARTVALPGRVVAEAIPMPVRAELAAISRETINRGVGR